MSNDYIPQTSAGDRYAAARKALNDFKYGTSENGKNDTDRYRLVLKMANALHSLVTPPSVGESEHDRAMRIASAYHPEARGTAYEAAMRGIRAGIQSAHESWESADRPTQEQMLRWLGLDYHECSDDEGNPDLHVYNQHIERED